MHVQVLKGVYSRLLVLSFPSMSVFSYVTDLLSSVMESLSDAIILIMLLFEEEEASPEVQMATLLLRLCSGR